MRESVRRGQRLETLGHVHTVPRQNRERVGQVLDGRSREVLGSMIGMSYCSAKGVKVTRLPVPKRPTPTGLR